MSEHNITVAGGTSTRLKTAGKYCNRDIIVTATGGEGNDPYFLFPYVKTIRLTNLDIFNVSDLVINSDVLTTIGQFAYTATNTKVTSITFNTPTLTGVTQAFQDQSIITSISFLNGISTQNAPRVFQNCSNLTTITGTLDLNGTSSGAYNNIFTGCTELRSVRFKPGCLKTSISFADCCQLNGASVVSIVHGLADYSGSTSSPTLTFNEQLDASTHTQTGSLNATLKAAITEKNWTLVLSK